MKRTSSIVVMAIGSKYRKLYDLVKSNIEAYAYKCGADLNVITKAPDPSFRRSILSQKLLVPSLFADYHLVCLVDLDVIISNYAPNIFAVGRGFKGFAATLTDRNSAGYRNTCRYIWKSERVLRETTEEYFTERGLPWTDRLEGSINGGVMLIDTEKLGPLFRDAYWSALPNMPNEEAIAAYVSQESGYFQALDARFNTQILHALSAEYGPAFRCTQTRWFRLLRRLHNRAPTLCRQVLYPVSYKRFLSEQVETQYITHFAGGYPFHGLSDGVL